jgi:hypothetical protein
MEYENHYASNGKGNLGVTLGAIGTGLGLLGGNGLGNILGGNNTACSEDHYINRYEAAQSARIAELETEVKLRDANTYTDGKILDVYRYIDGRLNGVEAQICQQNVVNAQLTANISCMQNTIATLTGLTKTVIPIDSICPAPAVATTTA